MATLMTTTSDMSALKTRLKATWVATAPVLLVLAVYLALQLRHIVGRSSAAT